MRPLLLIIVVPFLAIVAQATAGTSAPVETAAISFGDLGFAVMPPKKVVIPEAVEEQPAYAEQIPARVSELDGRRVRIRGYMIPTLLEDDGVREFIIVASPMMCCFGQTPEIYEYMLVRMIGKPSPMRENMPSEYEGVLRIGDIYEHGYWSGIFALECDSVKESG